MSTLSSTSSSEGEDAAAPIAASAKRKCHFKPQCQDAKKQKQDDGVSQKGNYSSVASAMMKRMGYQAGKGLGREEQGRVDIVPASDQRGRRGLGHTVQAQRREVMIDWKEELEPSEDEKFEWMNSLDDHQLKPDDSWYQIGKKKRTVEDEDLFCTRENISKVMQCKSIFDDLEGNELRHARSRCNPYESIKGGIFQNRAAMKMANIDRLFDHRFTNPSEVGKDEILYFADVCAGPGGFSEYVLWRRGWRCKGFGFTLKAQNDFKLDNFHSTNSELFEPHYGVGGADGDGNIMNTDNILAFHHFVLNKTNQKGVHFVMADGGISCAGQENIQELLTKQLLMCQFATALSILRRGGSFLCKTFDLFTPFTVGLVYLLRIAFERVTLMKPVTSRPANSERYVVCEGYRDSAERNIFKYMIKLNDIMNNLDKSKDVINVVPQDILLEDEHFVNYVSSNNNRIAVEQCKALAKIHAFVKDRSLREDRQSDMRVRCLKCWRIPDQIRREPAKRNAKELFKELVQDFHPIELYQHPNVMRKEDLHQHLQNIHNYQCYLSASPNSLILLSRGKGFVYLWDTNTKVWKNQSDMFIQCELPRATILEVEIVKLLKGQGRGQRRENALHVTDAIVLAGEDVSKHEYKHRIKLAGMLIEACDRTSTRTHLSHLQVKQVHSPQQISNIFDRIEMRRVKGHSAMVPCYQLPPTSSSMVTSSDDNFVIATGIKFVKICREPWTVAYSKTNKMKYYFNTTDKESTFELRPAEMIAPYHMCAKNKLSWKLDEDVDGDTLRSYIGRHHPVT